jgi:hypothetical protein
MEMDTSILRNTRKILGIGINDTSFDLDIILHINAAFSILTQIGVGPPEGFAIIDETSQWEDFIFGFEEFIPIFEFDQDLHLSSSASCL